MVGNRGNMINGLYELEKDETSDGQSGVYRGSHPVDCSKEFLDQGRRDRIGNIGYFVDVT